VQTRRIIAAGSLTLLGGCGVVHSTVLRADYETVDKTRTVRVVVVTSPLPDGKQAVGQLWSEIARHYANDHRDFIVKSAVAGPTEPPGLCSEGVEGVLHLVPKVKLAGAGVEEQVTATLTRCRDSEVVWRAEAGGSWSTYDEYVKDVIGHYVTELGEEVRPYVAPTYHLMKATLDAMPKPQLDENGKGEKIDLTD